MLTEALAKGLWLQHRASAEGLDKYVRRSLHKRFGELVAEVETALGAEVNSLSPLESNTWKAMNGFTHAAYIQVMRRHGPNGLGPNYPDSEVVQCLNAPGALPFWLRFNCVLWRNRTSLWVRRACPEFCV